MDAVFSGLVSLAASMHFCWIMKTSAIMAKKPAIHAKNNIVLFSFLKASKPPEYEAAMRN